MPVPGPAGTIDEAIATMEQIHESLDALDGVGCFNWMYLNVTREIREHGADFEDVEFLDALDVCFANFYFDAYARVARGEPCPEPWAPLFEHRRRPSTTRLQFALVGMNAHINHDLPFAVIETATARGVEPFAECPFRRDFFRVNDLLAEVEHKIKPWFMTGKLAEIEKHLTGVDDALTMWCIHGARRTAWDTAQVLWEARKYPELGAGYEQVLGELVNLAGRAVLV